MSYSECLLRVIVYEESDKDFVPVMSKPLYVSCTPYQNCKDLVVAVDDRTLLQKGRVYYAALCPVSSNGKGKVSFHAYAHKGFAWNIDKQHTVTLLVSMAAVLVGRENL